MFNVRLQTGSRRTRTSPKRWSQPREQCLKRDAEDVRYFLGRETIIVTHLEGMAVWREKLFAWMMKSSESAMEFFKLPTNRVVELGSQLQI